MMQDPLQELGNRLLKYQPSDAELGQRYRQEISALLHRGKPPIRRWLAIVAAAVVIVGSVWMVVFTLWIRPHPRTPLDPWFPLVASVGMIVLYTGLAVCAIRRIDPRRYGGFVVLVGVWFVAALAAILLHQAWQFEDASIRWQLTEAAFVMLGVVAFSAVLYYIEYYHKRTQLKLLELQYLIAELTQKLERP